MPGARLRNFRFGDNTELLAEFILNTFAFTTRVPRQEDVGHDLYCTLTERDGDLLRAGKSFTVQIKSNRKPLIFEKEHETAWIKKQDNPFFICVSDRNNLSLAVYSTWNMHNGYLLRKSDKIILVPGKPDDEYEPPVTTLDQKEQTVPLGKPILNIKVADVMHEKFVQQYRNVMSDWIEFERKNIVHKDAGMNWIVGPQEYDTNKRLDKNTLALTNLYWHGKNIKVQLKNFVRTAAELRLTIRHAFGPEGESNNFPEEQLRNLDRTLNSFSEYYEPRIKAELAGIIDMGT